LVFLMKLKMNKPVFKKRTDEDKKKEDLLVQQALKGNKKAFENLVQRYQRSVYHVIYKIIKDPEETKDLMQETFLKAYSSLSTYKSQFRFTTWLYRIAVNNSIDYLRKKKIITLSLDQKIETKYGKLSFEPKDWTYNPEKELVAKKKRFSIDKAIQALPKKYREVIVYRHKKEKSYKEISEILGIPAGTVKARIFRGRELLKKKLRFLR